MADFVMQLPTELAEGFEKLYKDCDKIFGGMTRAGAKIALETVKANVPETWRDSQIMDCIKLSRTYKTPSDGGINTKVMVSGYFMNKNGVKTPAPLVANMFEYGKTGFQKKPFFRMSFKSSEIQRAMLEAQKKLSGGLL